MEDRNIIIKCGYIEGNWDKGVEWKCLSPIKKFNCKYNRKEKKGPDCFGRQKWIPVKIFSVEVRY